MSETDGGIGGKSVVIRVFKGPYEGEAIVLDVERPAGRNLGDDSSDVIFSELNKFTNHESASGSSASANSLTQRWFIGRAKARRRKHKGKSAKANPAKLRLSLCKDPLISSEHACIEVTCACLSKGLVPERENLSTEVLVQIQDVGSSNGTKLNGNRIAKGIKHTLQINDVIRIGRSALRVEKIGTMEAPVMDVEDEGLFACPVCRKDLSNLNGTQQNKHVNDCLDGNKSSIENEAEDASVALAVALQNEPDTPIGGSASLHSKSMRKDDAASSISKCVVCGLNLSLMSVKGRERHMNQCLDASILPLSSRVLSVNSSSIASNPSGIQAAKKRKAGFARWFKRASGLDHCILCKKKWDQPHKNNPEVCMPHLRFCQQQHNQNLTVEELKLMVKAAEKKSKLTLLGWEGNNTTLSGPSPDDFVPSLSTRSKKRNRSTSKKSGKKKKSRIETGGLAHKIDKTPDVEIQMCDDKEDRSDEENAISILSAMKNEHKIRTQGKGKSKRRECTKPSSKGACANSTSLSPDQSVMDIRVAKLERQIAVIDSQIDKLKVYRGSLENNLNRAKLELSKSRSGLSSTDVGLPSPGASARKFFMGDRKSHKGSHLKPRGVPSTFSNSKLASEFNNNQGVDLWNSAACSQDPNFKAEDEHSTKPRLGEEAKHVNDADPLEIILKDEKRTQKDNTLQRRDDEESVDSQEEEVDDHALSQLIHNLDSSQSGEDEHLAQIELSGDMDKDAGSDDLRNSSGGDGLTSMNVASDLDLGSDSLVEISSDIPASDMMFGTGSHFPDGPVLGVNIRRISTWLAEAPACFAKVFPEPETQLKFVMAQDQTAIDEALRNLRRDKNMLLGEELEAMNYLESILQSLLSDLTGLEDIQKQSIAASGHCPDYASMSTKDLKALMDANGMKARPHTVMVERLTDIWRASQTEHGGASLNNDVIESGEESHSDGEDGSHMKEKNLDAIIFKTIIDDPKLYSHVLQFKAVRVPALRKMVTERNEGVRCTHKDCQAYLDSKGIANTWQ